MIIHVRDTDGTMSSVEAQPTDTIHTLRVKIMLEGIPLSDYRALVFNGERLWDSKATVSSYGIRDEDCVDVKNVYVAQAMTGFYVNVVQPEGEVIRVVADEAVPVIQIKHEVARIAGVEARKQQLKAGSEDMKDEKRLRDYGITEDAVVWMEIEGETKSRRDKRKEREGAGDDSLKNVLLFASLLVLVPLSVWLVYKRGSKN
ncbi:uncharacterized protein LOC125030016 [Penaeus chinensis]|uniref:uncharacterized protein LOC125030016 n=1 Tax=Penaeus chinensis TaxID=139456 RepID=UPI001FB65A2E|nr:uncharacterized protein LOC125030016 [Penaeus chinensis]XP_047476191.1 uncharacterized protein LOC125030016 [Penaeus chinensis]